MKEITDLPIYDLWPIIFNNLSIQDLFNCRLVNKQFKYFSDHTNGLNRLIIGEPEINCHDDFWYYNNKLIDDQEIISLKCFRTIKLLSIFNLDRNLKYLKIYDQQFKLEELSNLVNLESLEFGDYFNDNNINQQVINLNNLNVLVSNYHLIKLNSPKLDKMLFYDLNQIELLSNPKLIKHIITLDCDHNYDFKFNVFENLEIIEFRSINLNISENVLIIFKNLKQLKINLNLYFIKRIHNCLIRILNHKIKFKRNVDIYLAGMKIEDINKFNELVNVDEALNWKFVLDNYNLLDLNLPFITELDYGELEQCVDDIRNDLPISFFDKFFQIKSIIIFNVKNADNFNWFLNNLKCLKTLIIRVSIEEAFCRDPPIRNGILDQAFFDNLPNTIRKLLINKRDDLNYDFILKLTKLIKFSTYGDKDLFDLALKSFIDLKYLLKFKFVFKNKFIHIKKVDNDFYLNKRKLDYDQLIEQFNKIRLK